MRYLGIDYGTKKVGLALSDEAGTMGFPHAILPNSPKLLEEVSTLATKENIGAVVIGESRDYQGALNPAGVFARAFGQELAGRTGLPVFYESEVLTSAEARRAPAKEEKNRSPKTHEQVDASAAALILTSYLSHPHE